MKDAKMAELKFEAPLAGFDGDEWNDFHDFQTDEDLENSNKGPGLSNTSKMASERLEKNENSVGPDLDNFSETFSGSLEDLVNTFDEKITKCFCNFEEKVEKFAPVQVRSQEEIMSDCQMWWTITGNFGNILPIDWSKSYARQLHTKSLNLGEKRERDSPDLDLSDDEELQQAFDMHTLIISSLHQEPLFTAEEVINEIEGMMDVADDESMTPDSTPTGSDIMSGASTDLLQFKEKSTVSPTNYEESLMLTDSAQRWRTMQIIAKELVEKGLKNLSVSSLNELYEELECTIREYSETLIAELALRDELEYEKELKNQFISLLLSIQKKRRESQMDKRRNSIKKQKSANGTEPGTYLTTVIPYHPNQGPPSIDQLQIYIKILTAINDDSPTVPGLLTDYILKVLCPAT